MGSKVVSTKLTEEEYGKLVGLCSASGYTVSKLLKRAILERMNEENSRVQTQSPEPVIQEEPKVVQTPQVKNTNQSVDRFQYY
ncbi:MAG: hypothetical protein ACE5RN_05805 [Nitrosopumilaceae archaeon]